jgi:hypothetical protein
MCNLEIGKVCVNKIKDYHQLDVQNWYNNTQETAIENENTLIYPISLLCKYFDNPTYYDIILYLDIDTTHLTNLEIKYENYYNVEPRPTISGIIVQTKQNDYYKAPSSSSIFELNFDYSVFLLYFYGCDKTKINNIKLVCDNKTLYDGNVQTLDTIKEEKGIQISNNIIVMTFDCLFQKDKLNKTISFSNFSGFANILSPQLIIDTTEEEYELSVCALNYNIYTMNDSFRLHYSNFF